MKPNYPLYETTVFEDFRIMTENVANKYPDKYAFSFKKSPKDTEVQHITFSQSREYIRALGTGLIALGAREKKIAIIGEASFEWTASYFASMSIGGITVPLDKELPAAELCATINKAGCEFIIYSSAAEQKIEEISDKIPTLKHIICLNEKTSVNGAELLSNIVEDGKNRYLDGDNSYYDYKIDPDKVASIVFTSGTTGKGKGVMLSQTNIVTDMTQGMYLFDITPKTMMALPPHHTFGSTVNLVGHFAQGCEIYFTSGLRYIVQELKEQKPTHLVLVPLFVETFYKRIWASAEKQGKADMLKKLMKISMGMKKVGLDVRRKVFSSILAQFGGNLQMIICGGAALNQNIIDTFDAIGITILNGYGITECAPLVTCNRNKYQKKGSVGTPIIGEQVKISNPNENGEGEICVKGPNVMLGYYQDEKATADAFDEEGYFKTGDYGKLDSDGWLFITGRLKNLIIFSNGKNVYPEEIETEIQGVRGVNEVVVYAGKSISNPEKEVIVAEIYPDFDMLKADGVTDVKKYFEDNIKKINENMVSYKAVGAVKIRNEEFYKNTSKKIIRFKIDKTID